MIVRFGAAICGALFFIGCSSAVMAQSGIASVYAYAGERTASGERAHPSGFTAMAGALSCGSTIVGRLSAAASSTLHRRPRARWDLTDWPM